MNPALDLTRRHFTRHKGDITLIGTWVRTEDDWRPCLVLIRTGEELHDHTIPCVITVDKAWIWSEEVGDIVAAAHMTAGFLDALRITPATRNIIRLRSLVHDHLGDLLTIPPYQPVDQVVVAEVTATGSDGRVIEAEVLEDV